MSTAFIQICSSTELDESTERLKELQKILDASAQSLGFAGALYIIGFSKKVSVKDSFLPKRIDFKSSNKRHNFLFSNIQMKKLRYEFAKKAIKFDPNLKKIAETDFTIFNYEGDDENTCRCRQVLDKYGVKSRLYCRFACDDHPEFTGTFLLMSDKPAAELQQFVDERRDKIQTTLHLFHQMFFSSKAAQEIDPITGHGLITDKSKKILNLVSNGYSRTEISEMLYLTERGVDYHLSKLKILFDAKNNAQLIRKAFDYKVLS